MMRRLSCACLLAAALAAPAARAEVWGYVDDRGVAHFASERLDARYQLLFRSADSGAARAKTPRTVAVPTSPARLAAFLEVSPAYKQVQHHLREAAEAHGVDHDLLKALIATESGFNPGAVSPKGAVGLMQVMPATARRYGVRGDATTPLEKKLADPRTNIHTGTRYLADLMRMFPGQPELALAAYNAGEGAVRRAGYTIPDYPQTRAYVRTVMQLYETLKPPRLQPVRHEPLRAAANAAR